MGDNISIKEVETCRVRVDSTQLNRYKTMKCSNGHIYRFDSVNNDKYGKSKCPFCFRKKYIIKHNSNWLVNHKNCLKSFFDMVSYIKQDKCICGYISYLGNCKVFFIDSSNGYELTDLEAYNIDIDNVELLSSLYVLDYDIYIDTIIPFIEKSFNVTFDEAVNILCKDSNIITNICNERLILTKLNNMLKLLMDWYEVKDISNLLEDDIKLLDGDLYYRYKNCVTTKDILLHDKCDLLELEVSMHYGKNSKSSVVAGKHKKCVNTKKNITSREVRDLISQLDSIEHDIINKTHEYNDYLHDKNSDILDIKRQINNLCGRDVYDITGVKKDNLYMWLISTDDRELADIILNNYSTKNSKRLTEITVDSMEDILIKGKSGKLFKTTALTITSQHKVLKKLPAGVSFPELFVYYYFKGIFDKTIHRGKAPDTKYEYDIAIPEKKTVIEYNGHVYHKGVGCFNKSSKDYIKMKYAIDNGVNYIRIEDDGTGDKIKYSRYIITYNGNSSNIEKKLYEICMHIKDNLLGSIEINGPSIDDIKRSISLYH